MNYQLYSKKLEVTDSLKEYLDMRISNLDKIELDVISCRVDLSRDAHHRKGDVFRAEINVTVSGTLLRVVEKNPDIRAAIDIATEKLLRQAKKFNSKRRSKDRKIARFFKRFKR